VAYQMDDFNDMGEWTEMLKDFFPNHYSLACRAFRNQLPSGLPDWLVESTVASFFNMFATEEALKIFKDVKKVAENDPFNMGTVEEINFRTGESKAWHSGYPNYRKFLN